MSESSPTGSRAPSRAPPAQALRRRNATEDMASPAASKGVAKATRPGSTTSRRRPRRGHTSAQGAEISHCTGAPWVLVQGLSGEPLGLAHPAVVRRWRAAGKARMRRIGAAVVRLSCRHAEACFTRKRQAETATIGVDPGAKTTGVAVIVNSCVIWSTEITHRSNAITKGLSVRSGARSGRRCRHKRRTGRHRKESRFGHRTGCKGGLAPSIRHRVQSTRRWIRYVLPYIRSMCPSVEVSVEVCAFDAHKVLHPDVWGADYQRGPLWRSNLRGFVLTRDGGRCVYCGDGKDLTLDHVVPKSMSGADRHWNIVAACGACNDSKDANKLSDWLEHCQRASVRRRASSTLAYVKKLAAGKVRLNALAAANIVAPRLATKLEAMGLHVKRTSGADTAAWRRMLGVEKTHAMDAACTASRGAPFKWRCGQPLSITMTGRGSRLVIRRNASGFPRLKNDGSVIAGHRSMPPHGLRAGDVVRIDKPGFGVRQRTGTLTTARWDGRCVVALRSGDRHNIMASRLSIIHRGLGARIQ